MTKAKILFRGAEAIIYLDKNKIIKDRIKKSYRIQEIDEKVRKLRTRSESRILERASKVIPVPKVFNSNEKNKTISMMFIDGKKLSENLDNFSLTKQKQIMREVGKNTAKIHNENIIHGDLTTSNMICDSASLHTLRPKIYFIDFGLGFISHKIEDRAVDVYLLKEALKSRHFQNWKKLFDEFIKGYKVSKNSKEILERLKKVESRGRYKEKY